MEKPITVKREEFVKAIVDTVNGSDLPAFVKLDVMSNCLRELQEMARAELQRDLQRLKNEEAKENKEAEEN